MKIGDVIEYNGHLHAVANIDRYGIWLISLEHLDAIPFLGYPSAMPS